MGVVSSFARYPVGTAQFDAAVGRWIKDWAVHWRDMGLSPNQVGILIVDEPSTSAECRTIKDWAEAIHAAEPAVLVWQDQVISDPIDPRTRKVIPLVEQMHNQASILCPNRVTFLQDKTCRDIYRQQHSAGKPLHFYSCLGQCRWLDPYSYYRLQAWTCWAEGATGTFYWSFRDNGRVTNDGEPASSWNEYLGKGNYSPLYLDDATVTGSKQMEAIREGIEDYEYLSMLQSRIADLRTTGNPQLAAAQTLLTQAAARVLDVPGSWFWPDARFAWGNHLDRGSADQVRIEVLNMLEALTGNGQP